MRHPLTAGTTVLALSCALLAGCTAGDAQEGTTRRSTEPANTGPSQTLPIRRSFNEQSFDGAPTFFAPLAEDVGEAELRELVDDGKIPLGSTHGGYFTTMTNSMAARPAPDVMLFGDSMTQQGVDPQVLGEALSARAGREVTVFDAASSRARGGINRLVARYAVRIKKVPKVAVLVISTRAPEPDRYYSSAVQFTPFSSVVEGCDRPEATQWGDEDTERCRRANDDLRYRYRSSGGEVEWARAGKKQPTQLRISERSTLRADGYLAHPSMTEAEVEEWSAKRLADKPGFPWNDERATAQYGDLVRILEEQGTTVITTEIPYTPVHQRNLASRFPDYDARRQKAARTLAERIGTQHFPIASFGDWWGDGSSRDGIHLAPEGAADFARQLVDDTPGFADAVVAGL